jgi:hypothetical protein
LVNIMIEISPLWLEPAGALEPAALAAPIHKAKKASRSFGLFTYPRD